MKITNASIESAAERVLECVDNAKYGLPEPVFKLVSQLTPLVNVDLLIKDEKDRILLTWRADEFYGPGWHIPGGIIRFKESINHRILKVAQTELQCNVKFKSKPIIINEVMADNRNIRGHFISMLYECELTSKLNPENKANEKKPLHGQWLWHDKCPHDLISQHAIYSPYFNLVSSPYPIETDRNSNSIS